MARPLLSMQVTEMAEVVRRFIRFRHHFASVLPADLACLKEQLVELHPDAGPERDSDHKLFFHIGIILSERSQPMSMGELSEALDVPLSTATRMVDWVVKSGYAERLPDADDRRVVRVALTEAGRALYQSINEFVKHRIEEILGRLTPGERQTLIKLLRKVVNALEKEGVDYPVRRS